MINQATVLGRVGKMDFRYLSNGNPVANLSIVTTRKYTKDGQKTEKSTWHNICLYSKVAEIAQKYLHEGDLVYIQGEMDNQKYTDRNGVDRYKHFILGHELKLLPNSRKDQSAPSASSTNEHAFDLNDEIPF